MDESAARLSVAGGDEAADGDGGRIAEEVAAGEHGSERREKALRGLEENIAELDLVVVTGETEKAGWAVLARVGFAGEHRRQIDGGEIGIEDDRAVELDADAGADDGNFLKIPFTDGELIAAGGGHHAVGRAVGLAGIDGAFGLLVVVVENLEFAHADVGGVAGAGIAQGETIVAGSRQFKMQTGVKIGELAVPVDRAALALLPDERAVSGGDGFERSGPTVEIFTVEDRLKPLVAAGGEEPGGLGGTDFADEKIAPTGLAAVGLSWIGPRAGIGRLWAGGRFLS